MENFKIDVDADGIALITFDVPGRSMNTITRSVIADLNELVARIKSDDKIKGAVIASGKESGFCAGADLGEMNQRGMGGEAPKSEDERLKQAFNTGFSLNKVYRELETCGKPVVAAIEGLALGGGLEMCLACHYRVVADNPKLKLGLPEAKVGLLPGAGGTQRLPRLIGVQNAAMMILQGQDKSPQEAKGLGFVNEVVAPGKTVEAAKAWLKGKPSAVAPWDVKGYRVKDGPYTPGGAMMSVGGNAMVSKQTNLNYPAQRHSLSCIYEGVQVPIDAALRIESRYFIKTAATPQAKGMIRTLFVNMQALGKGGNRPANVPQLEVKKVAVIGAGLMGAGIAYVQAKAGVETVLIDVSQESRRQGQGLFEEARRQGRVARQITKEKGDALLALIKPTTDYAQIDGADLVIEAVFENPALKDEITKKAEAHLSDKAVFGSNTSTLPITGLAEASVRPKNFIGIHFFSPVERMGLVELIVGKETSQETLAKAIDYVREDPQDADHRERSPRLLHFALLRHLHHRRHRDAQRRHRAGDHRKCRPPMRHADGPARSERLCRPRHRAENRQGQCRSHRRRLQEGPARGPDVVDRRRQRPQRAQGGKGFYEYGEDGKPTRIWPELSSKIETKIKECPPELKAELTKRFLFRQCIEVARCFEEGVITDPRDADVGSILAWGFAPYSGGCVSYIDLFWGTKGFVEEADRLAKQYGDRFKPPQLLRDMAAKGESFYDRFGGKAKAAA